MHAGHARSRTRLSGRRAAALFTCLAALLTAPAVGASAARSIGDTQSGPRVTAGASCPSVVNGRSFASAAQLRRLVRQENMFGERYLASRAHNRTIGWIKDEVGAIDGFRVRPDRYRLWRWLPRTKAKGRPGLDLARAGGLTVTSKGAVKKVPVAGAVRWSKPTGKRGQKGQLVYVGADEQITAQNSAGKVVIREFPGTSLPYAALQAIGIYITPDLASATGNYKRPFIHRLEDELLAASVAGAAGVIFTFDVPREQVRGYGDPHRGTIYKVPALFVGGAEARRLKSLAARGVSARVVVRAKVGRATTTNVIATLPGRSSQKMVLGTNTDGQSWVQDDGVAGLIAFARYYAGLPLRCRPRTLQIAWASAHDAVIRDGMERVAAPLDAQFGRGRVAFAFAVEHLGTREIVPNAAGNRLRFTGKGEPFLFAAGNSDLLRRTAANITRRRNLDRTAVLQGLGLPTAGQVPPICSMGGLGTFFQSLLVPNLAMISGPWSLYAPSFRERAINYKRMRAQLLAVGDTVLALDGAPTDEIAGDYPEMREQRAQGRPTCPPVTAGAQFAPGPGE
jgi:hypothetical protein